MAKNKGDDIQSQQLANWQIRLTANLKLMRTEAKYSQVGIGKQIGKCRETIVAIERNNYAAVNALSLRHLIKWMGSCQGKCTDKTLASFKKLMAKQLQIPLD